MHDVVLIVMIFHLVSSDRFLSLCYNDDRLTHSAEEIYCGHSDPMSMCGQNSSEMLRLLIH